MIVTMFTIYYGIYMRIDRTNQLGITLIEIMLVIFIGAILFSIVASMYIHRSEESLVVSTDENILIIENALRLYRLDNGFYPTQAQGLSALLYKPTTHPIPQHWIKYLDKLPKDIHGHIYRYKTPGRSREIEVTPSSS
jgi:general secretion pathway protein G